jgi:hypothetical protein
MLHTAFQKEPVLPKNHTCSMVADSGDHQHAVADTHNSDAEFHFCPFANRQFVIVHTESGTQLPEELDSAAKLRANEQAMAKLAQVPATTVAACCYPLVTVMQG